MLDLLTSHPWLVALLWALLYAFDHGFTLWLVHSYQTTLSRYSVYEHGIELNPAAEKDIAARRVISLRAIIGFALVVLMVLLGAWGGPSIEEFVAGMLILTWCFVDIRHLRNFAYVALVRRDPKSVQGRQEYSYWFTQRLLASEALAFGLLYLFFATLTWRLFFLAGAFTCLILAIRSYILANRKFPTSPQNKDVLASEPGPAKTE